MLENHWRVLMQVRRSNGHAFRISKGIEDA